MKDMGQSARETLAPQINEPHQPAVSNSEQGAFTPGPWRLHSNLTDRICSGPIGPEAIDIADCSAVRRPASSGELSANARLIAAAPDLLAACKDCLGNRGDWLDVMGAAIRRAEGQS
jgi:hypothetical protein